MTINNIGELAAYWNTTVSGLGEVLFRETECGARLEWDESSVTIGSNIAGSDIVVSRTFEFPFSSPELDQWMKKLEGMTDKNMETAKPDGCYDEATIRQFIGIFESFLISKGICLSGNEKNAAGISGADYGALSGRIEALLNGLGLQKRG